MLEIKWDGTAVNINMSWVSILLMHIAGLAVPTEELHPKPVMKPVVHSPCVRYPDPTLIVNGHLAFTGHSFLDMQHREHEFQHLTD